MIRWIIAYLFVGTCGIGAIVFLDVTRYHDWLSSGLFSLIVILLILRGIMRLKK